MYFNLVAAIVGVLGTIVSLYLLYIFSISDSGLERVLQVARYFALAIVSFIIIGITEILELLFPSVEKFLIQINFIASLFVLYVALATLRAFGIETNNTPIFFGRFGMSILYISVLFLAANEVRGSEVAYLIKAISELLSIVLVPVLIYIASMSIRYYELIRSGAIVEVSISPAVGVSISFVLFHLAFLTLTFYCKEVYNVLEALALLIFTSASYYYWREIESALRML